MSQAIAATYEADFTFAESEPFQLESGGQLQPVTLHYAVYGTLNLQRDNVILACHALSGSAQVGSWWADLFGSDRCFDLDRDCVICVNILGSCYGSTGPSSTNPATGHPYGTDFPLITIGDNVKAQARLLDHLGIKRLRAVIGGSIGGMQAIRWAIEYPERIDTCISIGATPLSAMGLALNHIQRLAIENDPAWKQGQYKPGEQPAAGLGLARAVAMCSYKSAHLFERRYDRRPNRNGEDPRHKLNDRYDVSGYLDYQQKELVARFDANSYLYISKMMDNFDLADGYASTEEALRRITARLILVGISSDWLFPPADVRRLAGKIHSFGTNVTYLEQISSHGHDAFLAEAGELSGLLVPYLELTRTSSRFASRPIGGAQPPQSLELSSSEYMTAD
ncbi:MAG TPA: homoserine O-acetyltransferase [Terriglobales bacterium]|nr:homoserine O-acetyltransferase [Terriglobales bacterium]